jgi:hypothetical protein
MKGGTVLEETAKKKFCPLHRGLHFDEAPLYCDGRMCMMWVVYDGKDQKIKDANEGDCAFVVSQCNGVRKEEQ